MKSHERGHQRVKLTVEISLESSSNFYTARTRDISAGGVFVTMERPLARGTPVALQLTLQGSDEVFPVLGEVAWARPDGCGIRFVSLPHAASVAIEQFVRNRATIVR